MMMNIVRENKELKKYLIKKLLLKGEKKTALEMSEKLNISEDTFKTIECDIETQMNLELVQEEENEFLEVTDSSATNNDVTEDVPDTLTFDLNVSDIKFVTSKEEFIKCINDLSQNYEMIGIDSEWKPSFGLSHDRLSLIQLAVYDKVCILDILSLTECLDAEQWDKFMDDIFANPKIIKLGCGVTCDVNMIISNSKCTPGKTKRFSHILDISIFYRKLQEVYPEEMKYNNNSDDKRSSIGLSKLCEIILGKPLNKEERLCDWEKRPLTDSQLEYAALDAYCLLQMYDKLKKLASENNMNFDHLSTVAIVMTTSLWKPKKKIKGNRTGRTLSIQTPVPVEQFKVVMDSGLEILGKKLKGYGADVLILNKSDGPEDIAAVAESEGRIIICSEKIQEMVEDKVKDGFYYTVSKNPDELSAVADVIQFFNVQLNIKKIFSRCFICSNEDCIKLRPDDLNLLRKLVLEKESNTETCDLSLLRSDLQPIIKRMFRSETVLKFSNYSNTRMHKVQTFLCTKCGNIF
ncbi:putative exonuclease mut-7-like protein, partial [Stegodyphus mimosarum]